MKKILEEQLKKLQLEILVSVDAFCKKNNLKYFLTGGTLLGAIRHKGFIPWDDDIDIAMPRRDYEQFISSYGDAQKKNFRVVSIQRDAQYYLPFAKVINTKTTMQEAVDSSFKIGVYIDVFPIDQMTDNVDEAIKLFRKVKRLSNILAIKNLLPDSKRSVVKNLIIQCGKAVLFPIDRRKLLLKIDKLSRTYENLEDSKYVCCVCLGTYGLKEIVESAWYKTIILVPFEDHTFLAPHEYDSILKNFYGDYMQLPSPEKRCSHHLFQAWEKE